MGYLPCSRNVLQPTILIGEGGLFRFTLFGGCLVIIELNGIPDAQQVVFSNISPVDVIQAFRQPVLQHPLGSVPQSEFLSGSQWTADPPFTGERQAEEVVPWLWEGGPASAEDGEDAEEVGWGRGDGQSNWTVGGEQAAGSVLGDVNRPSINPQPRIPQPGFSLFPSPSSFFLLLSL